MEIYWNDNICLLSSIKKESELIHTFLDYFKEGNTPKKQVTVHNY